MKWKSPQSLAISHYWVTIFVFLLVFSPSYSSASNLNRTIILTESGLDIDFEWLDKNFDDRYYNSWAVLADIYKKCKWLEKYYRPAGVPLHYCWNTSPNSSQFHWMSYIDYHYNRFADFGLGQELSDGPLRYFDPPRPSFRSGR